MFLLPRGCIDTLANFELRNRAWLCPSKASLLGASYPGTHRDLSLFTGFVCSDHMKYHVLAESNAIFDLGRRELPASVQCGMVSRGHGG